MNQRRSRAQLLPGSGPLSRVPPAAAFLGVLVLFVAGVLIKGIVGAVLLGLLTLGVLALLVATWRVLSPVDRVMRFVVFVVMVAVTVSVLG
ncbi:hypothetical protein [Allokutzneria albata]|uniref:Uncharacterized protein n=1 Tax=Allokutzneria albata TaxID=211114 RepID=A0A1H0C9A0_ALLAB|nr:hypothetical protein [Allokutzneria albata]SDN54460.1 hypothetical protein SAMN04489726_7097 [Allokutzneria albata]